jgi:hypothetical protein
MRVVVLWCKCHATTMSKCVLYSSCVDAATIGCHHISRTVSSKPDRGEKQKASAATVPAQCRLQRAIDPHGADRSLSVAQHDVTRVGLAKQDCRTVHAGLSSFNWMGPHFVRRVLVVSVQCPRILQGFTGRLITASGVLCAASVSCAM